MSVKPKKVAFILPNLTSGGAERVAVNYLRQCAKIAEQTFLIIFDETPDLKPLIPDNVELINLKTIKTQRSLFALKRQLQSINPDIVYTTHSRVATLVALVRLLIVGNAFRHVARVPSMPSRERQNGTTNLVSYLAYRFGFRSADLVVAQTPEMQQDVSEQYGISDDKMMVAANPIDIDFIQSQSKQGANPFKEGKVVLVASGNHSLAKGFEYLIEAMSEVVKTHTNAELHILGRESAYSEGLQKLVADYALGSHVFFRGYQSNPYPFYLHSDVFVLSSIWEGFPNVLLENFMFKKTLVATECVPVVNEIVQEGVNGYLAEPGSGLSLARAITRALENRLDEQGESQYSFPQFVDILDRIH